ncbi:L-type lectin-domain containing receptor kinase IV.1-like [Cryptomeria japonica]|uniref:L-type lectin-domain containing receptor kinase IV.1-like n=1 Tax=Cryptomeria japonica TaxID=3369 RepID=UPI0027DA343D|nr:L-type lectin-domain containing receptor kinase IV.1-like [Cryptomeria japonica]
MAPNNCVVGAQDSEVLGITSPKTNGFQSSHFLAVEFDTAYDHDVGDIYGNHVGVNLNGIKSFESQPVAYWFDDDHFNNFSLKSGENKQAWIDYDHVEDRLNVSVAMYRMEKPVQPLISVTKLNLSSVLKEDGYVGFSASTGSQAIEDHHILGWSFSTEVKVKDIIDRDLIEEWELEFWPHRIPYEEIKVATHNFSDDQLVGCGGFWTGLQGSSLQKRS